jgi:hypothetical protein
MSLALFHPCLFTPVSPLFLRSVSPSACPVVSDIK